MAVTVGTRLGPYEITAQIGVGGMGEVYRATDTNLKRTVAIKVLPEAVATDGERLARFQREAEVLARLNHPNIASIFGLEKSAGTAALVMELIEGPTLADRIAQGPIPLDEALPIAKQIADALDAAHEQAIVHRDLKPANIKVTADGAVKVLDFGLAKVIEPGIVGVRQASPEQDPPTITSPAATRAGIILGTAAYMSPEQAQGRRVDKRTDLWAFGCVLYEMLTGRCAFAGDDVVAMLAAVVKEPPDWTALPAGTPEPLRRLLVRLLDKDPRRRVRDSGDARAELDAIDARSDVTPRHAQPPVRGWRIVAAASIGLIAGAIAGWMATRGAPSGEPPRVLHVSVRLPPDQRIVAATTHLLRIAISPDGRHIVYGANRQLHLRALDSAESTPIANTEDATAPFFSPDGQSIGFLQNSRLVRLALSGGTPTALAEVVYFAGARWGGDGTIVYADSSRGIFHVDSTGGTAVQLAAAESGVVFVPEVLPGSKWVLYSQSSAPMVPALFLSTLGLTGSTAGQFETVAYNLETRERRVILKNGPASYLSTGHLMYAMDQNAVFVAPFDAVRAELTGSETRIALEQNAFVRDVSLNGTLAFVKITPDVRRRPVWVTSDGSLTPLPLEPGAYRFPRLSPNGSRLAVTRADVRQKATDIWIYDVDGSSMNRLTYDGQSTTPAWTSDGARLAYSAFGKGPSRLFTKNADGSGSPQPLSEGAVRFPYAWFDRNTKLVFAEIRNGQLDLAMVDNASSNGHRVLLSSPANETRPDVSPDGRWLAYTSNESSGDEIYVRPMADLESGKWQVSTDGGHSPIWLSGGRELVYRAPGRMMSVAIRPGETFRFDAPRTLFADTYVNDTGGRSYDVASDGRFLMLSDEANSTDEIHLIVNWFEELRRQLQAK